jgi:hypothetical protein
MFADSVNSATPIRFPSTANLNIDSFDRYNNNPDSIATASDFTITQQTNILTGYFTRLAIVEMVLDWGVPNISALSKNNTLTVTLNGIANPLVVELDDGFYTVDAVMSEIVSQLNGLSTPNTFSFTGPNGSKSLRCLTTFTIAPSLLATQLTLTTGEEIDTDLIVSPSLLPNNFDYLDFVSPQLTYQQGLKDATTAKIIRDVLYRWNFAWDNQPQLDPSGYPILQGYTAFVQRRYLSFPKQIKWTGTQPIGQLSFQIYDASGKLLQYNEPGEDNYDFEWSMNILVSES